MSPAHRFAMLAAWLEGYAEGLPDYYTYRDWETTCGG